jgi:5'(3')-deoxyribonucleotidase
MIVLMDVDDVVANLVPYWIGLYNLDWNDHLNLKDITDWDLSLFTKPECGKKIYEYLEMKKINIYKGVLPVKKSLKSINNIRKLGHKIYFVTAGDYRGRKFDWLLDYEFISNHKEYIVCSDKSMIFGNLLIDDNISNVRGFRSEAWLKTAPWNIKFPWQPRVNNWDDIIERFKSL